jgi:UTP--glucose-1-phosphate uridylyltransferase
MAMITKAVIPAAGAGTRLLPATKAQPKEMLPILDTPAIQYVVQEAVDAGIRDILIITGRDKRAIEDHFDRNPELESRLERKGEEGALETVRALGELARIHYVRQPIQAGLGDAIRYARAFVGEEPFAVLLGDTVFDASVPVTRQLLAAFEEHSTPILAVEEVPSEKVDRYGIVEGEVLPGGMVRVERLVEKPAPEETESTLAIAGRYVLTPEVFQAIEATEPGCNDEVQLTDALAAMLPDTGMVAVPIQGRRFDIGNKLDYLSTVMAFALKHEDYAPTVRSFLASLPDKGEGE